MIWMNYAAYFDCIEVVRTHLLPRYATYLSYSAGYKTIKLYLNGVRLFYISRNMPNPLADNYQHKQHMESLRRIKGDISKPKLPITVTELLWLAAACDATSPADVAFTVAALIAFFAFLRKSNVTTGVQQSDDITHALLAGDVVIDNDTYTLWITLRCTKTIQFGERKLYIPIAGMRGSPIDPIAWWKLHLRSSALPRKADAHAFAYQVKGTSRWVNLTHSAFVKRLKLVLARNGVDSANYAAHSFRRGGATFAYAAGVGDALIKALGDWRSNAYLRYIELSTALRVHAARQMAKLAASSC
jgi:integrase